MKLSKSQGPISDDDRKKMDTVPCTSGVGSIMYGMVCTRPDLAHAVSVVSRFMVEPGQAHWEALKWILRYINGSLDSGLLYHKNSQGGTVIEGFVDADFARCLDTRKSLSGYMFTLFGTAVS